MPDYADLLDFLANNPPQLESERQLHASLLELMAQCLRTEASPCEQTVDNTEPLEDRITESHIHWVRFN
jgi:nitrate reductase assembly molybdenum cofactor insertion protein NarJ